MRRQGPGTIAAAGRRDHRRGFLLVEIVVALSVLGLLATCMARLQATTGRYHTRLLGRQWCVAAGRAQLDSLATTGQLIDADDVERLWPGLTYTMHTRAGEGDWAGLTLATVNVTGRFGGCEITVTQARYLAPRREAHP